MIRLSLEHVPKLILIFMTVRKTCIFVIERPRVYCMLGCMTWGHRRGLGFEQIRIYEMPISFYESTQFCVGLCPRSLRESRLLITASVTKLFYFIRSLNHPVYTVSLKISIQPHHVIQVGIQNNSAFCCGIDEIYVRRELSHTYYSHIFTESWS